MGPLPHEPAPDVEVRRSTRRRRTVSAYRDGTTIVVLLPARLSRTEEQEWVATMVAKVGRAERRRRPDDRALSARADLLSRRYLDGLARAASVRWVTNQHTRWGSCTPLDRSIRLSTRLQGMPAYVVDYVLLHELAHLLVPGHGDDFWQWVSRFELTERARGYLDGVAAARNAETGRGGDDTGGPAAGGAAAGGAVAGGAVAGGAVAGGAVAGGSVAGGSVAGGSVAGGAVDPDFGQPGLGR